MYNFFSENPYYSHLRAWGGKGGLVLLAMEMTSPAAKQEQRRAEEGLISSLISNGRAGWKMVI